MSSKSISVDPTLALDTAGQAPLLVAEIFNIIRDINQDGTTLLLVEQNARKALSIASRAYVLETGKIIREGRGVEL